MTATATAVFSHLDLRVAVSSPQASDLQWLRESMTPAFSVDAAVATASVHLRVVIDRERHRRLCEGRLVVGATGDSAGESGGEPGVPMFGFDGHSAEFRPCSGAPNCVQDHELGFCYALAEPDGHLQGAPHGTPRRDIEIIAQRWKPSLRIALLRMLRELATQCLPAAGCLQLHAAALEWHGRGLVICGPRRAGKTSLLLHLLRADGSRYLANDRALLHPPADGAADGRWPGSGLGTWVSGMPTVVSIRERSVTLFAALALDGMRDWLARMTLAEVKALTSPLGSPLDAVQGASAREASAGALSLSPAQLLDWLGIDAVSHAPLAGLLFPEVDPAIAGIRLERLSDDEISAQLEASLMPPRATVLTRWVDGLAAGVENAVDTPADIFAAVAVHRAGVPGYRCRLGRDAFVDAGSAGQLLAQLAAAYPPPRR